MILHLDLDCYFVSVERALDPRLRGRPVIVGGRPEERGVVCSASYECRAFGVHNAMPSAQAIRLCPDAVFIPPRGPYREVSAKVRRVLDELCPVVVAGGLDEFYLDLRGCEALYPPSAAAMDLTARQTISGVPWVGEVGLRAREQLLAELELPSTVGAARVDVVAKIASKVSKPGGLLTVAPGLEADLLAPLPLSRMPGIGEATERALAALGFRTLGDVARADSRLLERKLGSFGHHVQARCRGEGTSRLDASEGPPRSISHEETFPEDVTDGEHLVRELADQVARAAWRLRGDRLFARNVTLKVRFADFTTVTRSVTIEPSDHDDVLRDAALHLLEGLHLEGRPVRLIGVALRGLTEAGPADLFADRGLDERRRRLYASLDQLRDRGLI